MCFRLQLLHLTFLVVQMDSPGLRVARRRNGRRGARCGTGSTSNDFFEVVQIEPEVEEVFDLLGVAELEGWDQTKLMYFVFEFGTKKGMQYCREYYEMKNSARQVVLRLWWRRRSQFLTLLGLLRRRVGTRLNSCFFVFE